MRKNNIHGLTIIDATNFENMWEKIIEFYFLDKLLIQKIGNREIVVSVILEIKSIDLGNLLLKEVGYGRSKMSILWNNYINDSQLYELKHKICNSLKEKMFSFNYLFKNYGHVDKDNCLTSMTIVKIQDNIIINLLLRASEAVKVILGDFFLIHEISRILFPIEYLNKIRVRFNCSYIYFSIPTLIVILNNLRFGELLSKNTKRIKNFKKESGELILKDSKLAQIQRSIDYVKTGYVKKSLYDYYQKRCLYIKP